ncbi:MAG: hypothetical protein V4592_10160 [Bacteroidota bacterium]
MIKKIPYSVLMLTIALSGYSNLLLAQQNTLTDSIKIAAYPSYNHVSFLHKAFWGKNYRELWAVPVNMKVFYIEKENGGLTITDVGGGNQTRSLQLTDAAGHQWALRSVQKFPERALPADQRHTVLKDILQDEVSTSNPYAALTVPPLADALNIPHSNPVFVYLPDDPALGKYRKEFANHVYLFEEREPLDGTKTYKTEKVQEKLQDDNDNQINQKQLLRARLLDMIIGDWDRHGDQWRWEKQDTGKITLYQPIPKDRDKVFYSTSGVFPFFAALANPQLQPYNNYISKIEFWNANATFFDMYFLNQLSKTDWEQQIAYVQSKLTDDVLTSAMKKLPADIYKITGRETTQKLIARRNHIKEDALNYYHFLAKNVDISASDKKEQFTVNELDNGGLDVTVRSVKKDDSLGKVVYHRALQPDETKSIRLYGMGGKDAFIVNGHTPSPIKVRMIGGDGEDKFVIDSALDNRGKLVVYDRSDEKNDLPPRRLARVLASKDTNVNKYDKTHFKYDLYLPKVGLGYNTEDGVRLEVGYSIEKHGFRDSPYVYKQELTMGYTLSKSSFIFTYLGDFKQAVGTSDLGINIIGRGPNNVNSFFGYGNNSVFVNQGTKSFNYYRNRYDHIDADIRLYHQYGKWRLSGGIIGQYYTSNLATNINHYFYEFNQQQPADDFFATKAYGGLVLGAELDTRDSKTWPTKGVYWSTKLTGLTGINVKNHTNGQLFTSLNFYLNPGSDSVFVIADRIGGGIFTGRGEFFQMMNLGGPLSLQGYHTSRFIGKQMIFNNLELRLKLFKFNTYVFPGTLGVIAYNDAGRVWTPGESSDTIHDAYGGGIFITPYNKMILSAVMGQTTTGADGALLYLSAGFRF